MKIYVASSWRNELQPSIVAMLRDEGHQVYDFQNPPSGSGGFAWSGIDPNWRSWTTEQFAAALQHPIAAQGFDEDFDGMKWADLCVLVLPCGRSAHTEAGWFAGQGKPVIALAMRDQEPELMYKVFHSIVSSPGELAEAVRRYDLKNPDWQMANMVNPPLSKNPIWHSLGLQKERVDEISQDAAQSFEALTAEWQENNGGKINYTEALVRCTRLCRTPNELVFIAYLVTRTVQDYEVEQQIAQMDKKQRKAARRIIAPDNATVKSILNNKKH